MPDTNGPATLANATPRADLEYIAKWEAARHRWLLSYPPGYRSRVTGEWIVQPVPATCSYCGAPLKSTTTWRAALLAMRKARKGRAVLKRMREVSNG